MCKTLQTPYFSLKPVSITKPIHSDILPYDKELSNAVGKPLFDLGMHVAVIAKRIGFKQPRVHTPIYHTFMLMLAGEMDVVFGDTTYKAGPGTFVYSAPGTRFYRYSPPSAKTWFLYFHFTCHPFWERLAEEGSYVRDYEHSARMFLLLRSIIDVYQDPATHDLQSAIEDSAELVTLLKREVRRSARIVHHYDVPLKQLINDIRATPAYDWTLGEMARRLNVSISTLRRIFIDEYNTSPINLVVRERMQAAKMHLLETDRTVETIARDIGYNSPYSFSRLFKKHMGLSPRQFRSSFGSDIH